jgi:hypothetical protein
VFLGDSSKSSQRKWPSKTRLFLPYSSSGGKSVLVGQFRGPQAVTANDADVRRMLSITSRKISLCVMRFHRIISEIFFDKDLEQRFGLEKDLGCKG